MDPPNLPRLAAAVVLSTLAGCAGLKLGVAPAGGPGAAAKPLAAPAKMTPQDLAAQIRRARTYLAADEAGVVIEPLEQAAHHYPKNREVLLLLGVANDMTGHYAKAQDWYRRGLAVAPADRAFDVDLAMSLALAGDYPTAIKILQPLSDNSRASEAERQTLALIYGLAGNDPDAARLGKIDLDPAAVQHNLAYYDMLRSLSPAARNRIIMSWVGHALQQREAEMATKAASAAAVAADPKSAPHPVAAGPVADW